MKSDPPVIGICATVSDLTVVHRVRVFVVLGACAKGNVSTSAELQFVRGVGNSLHLVRFAR